MQTNKQKLITTWRSNISTTHFMDLNEKCISLKVGRRLSPD